MDAGPRKAPRNKVKYFGQAAGINSPSEVKAEGSRYMNTDGPIHRRTSRIHLAIPIFVYGRTESGDTFKEISITVTINAGGCMIELATPVAKEQPLLLAHMRTGEEIACHVVSHGANSNGKVQVGVRFAHPSPRFWGLAFPPEDWDPANRKRPEPVNR